MSIGSKAGPPAGSGVALRPLHPCGTLLVPCLAVYGIVIVVRLALYIIHVEFQRWGPMALVSDHLLLAASVVACFQVSCGRGRWGLYVVEEVHTETE